MRNFIIKLIIYMVCFGISMYGLGALNYEKFLRSGKTMQAQVLFIIIAMSIAWLMSQFLINITYFLQ